MKPIYAILVLLLAGCTDPLEVVKPDQCLRREIFVQCLSTVKNGANQTHKDLGPLVEECSSAAYYMSMRKSKDIKEECKA